MDETILNPIQWSKVCGVEEAYAKVSLIQLLIYSGQLYLSDVCLDVELGIDTKKTYAWKSLTYLLNLS